MPGPPPVQAQVLQDSPVLQAPGPCPGELPPELGSAATGARTGALRASSFLSCVEPAQSSAAEPLMGGVMTLMFPVLSVAGAVMG